MHQACLDMASDMEIICLTAAVSDFYPVDRLSDKAKKTDLGQEIWLQFFQNPDILADIGLKKKKSQFLIGFAAETKNMQTEAIRKLHAKRLDLVVANNINTSGCGFRSADNQVFLADAHGRRETWPKLPKPEIAMRIMEWFLDCNTEFHA
jgi:phosphopantothenoylcysteine decarboxylase / phosphopantothenate---cysteine ligase